MSGLILVYHRVAEVLSDPWSLCVTPVRFAQQLEVLRREWHPMSLGELRLALQRGSIPDRSVVVTFDDGYADNLHSARPLLEQFNVPATVFVVAGLLGGEGAFWWDELEQVLLHPGILPPTLTLHIGGAARSWELGEASRYSEHAAAALREWRAWEPPPTARHAAYLSVWQALQPLPQPERLLVLAELRGQGHFFGEHAAPRILQPEEVLALGRGSLVDIGAHTVTHPSLAALPVATQRFEVLGSRTALRDLLGSPVTSFAYPFGAESNYTAETVILVREAGFDTACTTFAGMVDAASDPLRLPRRQAENWEGERFSRQLTSWFDSRHLGSSP